MRKGFLSRNRLASTRFTTLWHTHIHRYVHPPTRRHKLLSLSSYTNPLTLYKLIIKYSARSSTFCSAFYYLIFFPILFYIFYSISMHPCTHTIFENYIFFAHWFLVAIPQSKREPAAWAAEWHSHIHNHAHPHTRTPRTLLVSLLAMLCFVFGAYRPILTLTQFAFCHCFLQETMVNKTTLTTANVGEYQREREAKTNTAIGTLKWISSTHIFTHMHTSWLAGLAVNLKSVALMRPWRSGLKAVGAASHQQPRSNSNFSCSNASLLLADYILVYKRNN